MQGLKKSGGSNGVSRLIRDLQHGRRSVAPELAPGTRLLREWQGRTHHVTVLAEGFEHDGKTYRSLTAVAPHITRIVLSRPLFLFLYPTSYSPPTRPSPP